MINLILKNKRPSALVVSRDATESYKFTSVEETAYGGYVISEVKSRLDVIEEKNQWAGRQNNGNHWC